MDHFSNAFMQCFVGQHFELVQTLLRQKLRPKKTLNFVPVNSAVSDKDQMHNFSKLRTAPIFMDEALFCLKSEWRIEL